MIVYKFLKYKGILSCKLLTRITADIVQGAAMTLSVTENTNEAA